MNIFLSFLLLFFFSPSPFCEGENYLLHVSPTPHAVTELTTSNTRPSPVVTTAHSSAAFDWPTRSHKVVTPFHPPAKKWMSGHRGIDIATAYPEDANEQGKIPIYSASNGRVRYAGTLVNRGVVSIEHSSGLRLTYEPLEALVHVGDEVRKGDLIGYLMPGHPRADFPVSSEYVLHVGAKFSEDSYINPLLLFEHARVRLLPIEEKGKWEGKRP